MQLTVEFVKITPAPAKKCLCKGLKAFHPADFSSVRRVLMAVRPKTARPADAGINIRTRINQPEQEKNTRRPFGQRVFHDSDHADANISVSAHYLLWIAA